MIRINRHGLRGKEADAIMADLAESLALNRQHQRLEGIAVVGETMGKIFVAAGHAHVAAPNLEESAAAYEQLGRRELAARARDLANPTDDTTWIAPIRRRAAECLPDAPSGSSGRREPRMSCAASSGTSSCGQWPMPSSSTQSACGSQSSR